MKIDYSYDRLNQLTRENNPQLGYTYVYEYDTSGNITKKSTYNYQRSSLAGVTPINTNIYGYTNTEWGDLLTSYNGVNLTYDEIGNPLYYYNGFEYTLTWSGKQLMSAVMDGDVFTFTYNSDGIRTSKTVNGVGHTFNLNGSQIIRVLQPKLRWL